MLALIAPVGATLTLCAHTAATKPVNELRQLNERVERGQIRSMPDYDDPTRPGLRYIKQLDYEIRVTRDPDTQDLFRELEQEAS